MDRLQISAAAFMTGHDCLSLRLSDIIQLSLRSHGRSDIKIKFIELAKLGYEIARIVISLRIKRHSCET